MWYIDTSYNQLHKYDFFLILSLLDFARPPRPWRRKGRRKGREESLFARISPSGANTNGRAARPFRTATEAWESEHVVEEKLWRLSWVNHISNFRAVLMLSPQGCSRTACESRTGLSEIPMWFPAINFVSLRLYSAWIAPCLDFDFFLAALVPTC